MSLSDLLPASFHEFLKYAKTQFDIELLDLRIWYLKRKWSFILIQQGKRELQTGEEGLFPLTILLIAKMAYADTKLSNDEHKSIEELLQSTLRLDDKQLIVALGHFRKARSNGKTFRACAEEFYARFRKSSIILENTIDILLALALADGRIDDKEEQILSTALEVFQIPAGVYQNLKRTRLQIHSLKSEQDSLKNAQVEYEEKTSSFEQRASSRQRTHSSPAASDTSILENYYRILNCSPTDSMQTIKSSYRKLVMKHHPDRYAAEGMSEEMKAFSLERFREIQRAYDEICLRRE